MESKWYQKTWAIILLLLFFAPVGIFLMYKYTNWGKKTKIVFAVFFGLVFITSVLSSNDADKELTKSKEKTEQVSNDSKTKGTKKEDSEISTPVTSEKEKKEETTSENEKSTTAYSSFTSDGFDYNKYTLITVDGGDMSGYRKPNVRVDVGFGDREYWAFTNEYGQLIRVEAKIVTLQNPITEKVLSSGRYYSDEAKVPGTERSDLDEGHVIADSLGGVSNAFNITPQNSVLNRNGDQAYMEKWIRDAGGCTDFVAVITYPDTKTQIPSHYKFSYIIKGTPVTDGFDNVNPDEVNKSLGNTSGTNSTPTPTPAPTQTPANTSTTSSEPTSTSVSGSGAIPEQNQTAIVFYVPNGKSYHSRKDCSTLSRSKDIRSAPLSEVLQLGKTDPCDKCY